MNPKSAAIIAAGLVFALTAGVASRFATIHPVAAAAPVRIVVQTTAPGTATAPAPALSPVEAEKE
jgi:hypothetical protein